MTANSTADPSATAPAPTYTPAPAPAPGPTLYLASQSPRRRQLLAQIGAAHALLLPGADEDAEALEAERAGELPAAYVQRVTLAKLRAAVARRVRLGLPPGAVLCADTTVALGRRILGKPADAQQAAAALALLSGRTHRVLTALALHDGSRVLRAINISHVRFAVLPPAVIDRYVASGDAFGKAGSYAIQSALAGWIVHIRGSHSGIMGLPLHETAQLLRRAGVALAL
ncbi:MAG: Maf family nucleotide pyrophosphatase [Rubrivivax sp.]|nr:Maf family nucleotide pyrophosphatase [Rubrivivax sp.]